MIYALDTNVISYLLRPSQNKGLVKRFIDETKKSGYVIPPLCYYEILWYLLRKKATTQLNVFNEFYKNSSAKINMSESVFIKAAEIRATLEERGTPIGGNDADIFIAAFCLVNGYTLVTNNMRHFEHIDGLKLVNWVE